MASVEGVDQAASRRGHVGLVFVQLAVIVPTVVFLAIQAALHWSSFSPRANGQVWEHAWPNLILWSAVVAGVELLPVPAWRGLRISLVFPVIIATTILFPPWFAGIIAFVGCFDPREFTHSISLLRALFNRSQFAIAALTAGGIISAFGATTEHEVQLLVVTVLAVAGGYAVNVLLVCAHASVEYGVSPLAVLAQLRIGGLTEFLVSYVGLGLLGAILALLTDQAGIWALATFLAPLLLARQMFFKSLALEEASDQLRDRLRVTRALSNRMAEERQDERSQIAGYLHDDLAQSLFQLTLRLEMAKKRLANGDMEAVAKDLDDIGNIKERTSVMVRSLVRDLHRNPIGRKGLGEALQSFGDEVTRDTPVEVAVDVVEVTLPPPIQLLIYQIGREAVMNAMKYAEPTTILISLKETDDGVELQIRDDGKGFDTSQPQPEGHFGSVMMKERAMVAGGTFNRESEIGKGTIVTAEFPRVWIEEQMEPGLELPSDDEPEEITESASEATPAPAGDPAAAAPAPPAPATSPSPAAQPPALPLQGHGSQKSA
jgi:signal transduction histidine kinase